DEDLLEAIAAQQLPGLTAKDVIDMGIHGVDEGLLESARERYGKELRPKDIIDMAIHGDWDDEPYRPSRHSRHDRGHDPAAEIDEIKRLKDEESD
ncbi:MAG: hypothetical protein KDE09_25795, partial [Anaerolineales bacterium]|nr:hypothetical protein [Anaerolineales bacterium]